MATIVPVVFLSSRFEEFRPLRSRLKAILQDAATIKCNVIDLEDSYPDGQPPWRISVEGARSADVFVLFVGGEYGSIPSGKMQSYVELEYSAAVEKGSRTQVLAYLTAEALRSEPSTPLGRLCEKIACRHRYERLNLNEEISATAYRIAHHVQRAALTLLSAVSGHLDGYGDTEIDDSEEYGGDALEQDRRIENDPHLRLITNVHKWSDRDLMISGNRARLEERRQQAISALEQGEWRRALWYLRQCIQREPWDLPALFWSARLRLISGRRDDAEVALRLAVRATRVARSIHQGGETNIPLAACFLQAARAAAQKGEVDEAVGYAEAARAAARFYWRTHYELARQHGIAGEYARIEDDLRSAFFLNPRVWKSIDHDDAFARCRDHCTAAKTHLLTDVRGEISEIHRTEVDLLEQVRSLSVADADLLSAVYGGWTDDALAEASAALSDRYALIDTLFVRAKRSFMRRVELLSKLATHALALHHQLDEASTARQQLAADYADKKQALLNRIAEQRGQTLVKVSRMDNSVLAAASVVAVLFGGITIGSWGIWAVLLSVGILAGGVWGAREVALQQDLSRFTRRKEEELLRLNREFNALLTDSDHRKCEAKARCDRIEDALAATVRVYQRGVVGLEGSALKRRIYCPTPARGREGAGDLVILDGRERSDRYTIDTTAVPDFLEPYLDEELHADKHLFRISGDGSTASRRACYFPS